MADPEVRANVQAAVDRLVAEGTRPSFLAVAREAGCNRTTLYRDDDLRALVEAARGPRQAAGRKVVDRAVWAAPGAVVARVADAVRAVEGDGLRCTVTEVARRSGVARKTIYRHPELLALVEQRRRPTPVDPAAGELAALRAELAALSAQVRSLQPS